MTFRLLALLVAFAAPAVLAQSVPDWAAPSASSAPAPPDAVPPPPPPPPPVPVDGGLILLGLAGAGLAARKLRAA